MNSSGLNKSKSMNREDLFDSLNCSSASSKPPNVKLGAIRRGSSLSAVWPPPKQNMNIITKGYATSCTISDETEAPKDTTCNDTDIDCSLCSWPSSPSTKAEVPHVQSSPAKVTELLDASPAQTPSLRDAGLLSPSKARAIAIPVTPGSVKSKRESIAKMSPVLAYHSPSALQLLGLGQALVRERGLQITPSSACLRSGLKDRQDLDSYQRDIESS
jgi:hypothetical protein